MLMTFLKNWPIFIFLGSVGLSETVLAISPQRIVYRVDARSIEEITVSGGLLPRNDGMPDTDLTHHFIGESVEGNRSAFVSTSYILSDVIRWFATLTPYIDGAYNESAVGYIYAIRPSSHFYDVELALNAAREQYPPDSISYFSMQQLLNKYAGMHELVALNGITTERIMAYARIDGSMLNRYGIADGAELFSEMFWAPRWINNAAYHANDTDTSNVTPYPVVSLPRGFTLEVQADNKNESVSLANSCAGVSSAQKNKSTLAIKMKTCSKFKITKTFYDTKTISLLLDL